MFVILVILQIFKKLQHDQGCPAKSGSYQKNHEQMCTITLTNATKEFE